MIKRAVILSVAFCVLAVLGGRGHVEFLSGSAQVSLRGALYFMAWFGVVLVVPILVIASLLRACHGKLSIWLASRRR